MAVKKINKDGTKCKRSSNLTSDELYYIRRHLEHGTPKEKLAERCCCDISDIEKVQKTLKRKVTQRAIKEEAHGNSRVSSRV